MEKDVHTLRGRRGLMKSMQIAVLSDQDSEDNLTSKTLSDTQRILPTAGILCNTWSKAKVEIKSI